MATVLIEITRELAAPPRLCPAEVCYCGDFYGQIAAGTPLPDIINAEGSFPPLATLPRRLTDLGC